MSSCYKDDVGMAANLGNHKFTRGKKSHYYGNKLIFILIYYFKMVTVYLVFLNS